MRRIQDMMAWPASQCCSDFPSTMCDKNLGQVASDGSFVTYEITIHQLLTSYFSQDKLPLGSINRTRWECFHIQLYQLFSSGCWPVTIFEEDLPAVN